MGNFRESKGKKMTIDAIFLRTLNATHVSSELSFVGPFLLASYSLTYFLTKSWIKSSRKVKFFGKDMNKYSSPLVSRSGGLIVTLAVCFSLLLYTVFQTYSFLGIASRGMVEVFAISATVLLAGFLGFVDDVLGWKEGLPQLQKVLLTVPVALPLLIINAGSSVVELPFLGNVDLGLLYPILIIPLGVIGSTNGYNLLAGYNGLEAGMGLIIFAAFGVTSFFAGNLWITLIALVVCSSLLAFLSFNWFPAKVFPGNSFTYSIGALIAALAIIGNMEKIAIWLFIPYFFEILLYFRARVIDGVGDVQAFAKSDEDNSLEMPYKKIYDTTHFSIWFLKKFKTKVYERDVVLFILAIQTLISVIGILLLFP
jgi:UDP-N-acetylglucosamine--dolichyl-phosphate N-acetylglucosaminephosphotransferase